PAKDSKNEQASRLRDEAQSGSSLDGSALPAHPAALKEALMRPIVLLFTAVAIAAGAAVTMISASGQAGGDAAPIYGIKIPQGYRDWRLISANHLAGNSLKQVRAQLGNDIAFKAFQDGKLPFPDGTIIAALHWNEASSDENDKVLASGFPGAG